MINTKKVGFIMIKKIITTTMMFAVTIGLFGCGSDEETPPPIQSSTTSVTTENRNNVDNVPSETEETPIPAELAEIPDEKFATAENISARLVGVSSINALKDDGSVWAWGNNDYAEIGFKGGKYVLTPHKVQGVENIKSLSWIFQIIEALDENGVIYRWGGNREAPEVLDELSDIKQQVGAMGVQVTLKSDGSVWSSGAETFAFGMQLTQIELPPIEKIVVGNYCVFAITENGEVYAWGENHYGQLGIGTTAETLTPTKLTNLTNIVDIVSNSSQSFALCSNGDVYAWGNNELGIVGNGRVERSSQTTPYKIQSLIDIKKIYFDGYNNPAVYAINKYGQVYSWGRVGSETVSTPQLIIGLNGVTQLALDDNCAFAVTVSGHVYAWGQNWHGSLGNGKSASDYDSTYAVEPLFRIEELKNIVALSSHHRTILAIEENGEIWGWGSNYSGELLNGKTGDNYTSGDSHAHEKRPIRIGFNLFK